MKLLQLVEAGFKSRTNGITVASALTRQLSQLSHRVVRQKTQICLNKATAQASRRTGRS